MEQNAWMVAKNVADRINHESSPAGDYMQSFVTPRKNEHFLFNTEQLCQFVAASDSMKDSIPGAAYFKKIRKYCFFFSLFETFLEPPLSFVLPIPPPKKKLSCR